MTIVWSGVTIDNSTLPNYGYRDTVVVDGVPYPRYIGYMAAGINQFAANFSGYATTITTNIAAGQAAIADAIATGQAAITTSIADGQAAVTASIAAGQTTINGVVSGFSDISTSTGTIGLGATTLTVGANKGFRPGMLVTAYVTADPTKWMTGLVTSYTPATGALTVNVTGTNGAGTFAAWTVALSGTQGVQGVQGVQGIQGIQGIGGSGSTISAQQDGAPITTLARANINATLSVVAVDDAAGNRIGLSLKGDSAAPGPGMIYGTDSTGAKGWKAAPVTPDPLYALGLTF